MTSDNRIIQSDVKQRRYPPNPYRNILFCSKCGAPMLYELYNHNGANPYLTYACATGIKKGQCTRHRTRFTYVDTRIREALQDEIDLADSIYSRIEAGELPAACVQAEDQYQSEVQQLLDTTLQSNRVFQALYSDFLLGKVTTEQYLQQKLLLMTQIRISGQHLLDAVAQIKSFRALFTLDNPWLKLYRGKILPEVLPREVSKSYLECVCLSPDGDISITLRYQGWKQKLLDMED